MGYDQIGLGSGNETRASIKRGRGSSVLDYTARNVWISKHIHFGATCGVTSVETGGAQIC